MVYASLLCSGFPENYHGGVTLVSSLRDVTPGASFDVAVRISLDPGWHTYWQNPGDAGIPPRITWSLPDGWKAGEIRWPIPHRLVAPEVVSYGYEREALLLVRLTVPASAKFGSQVSVKAKVDWLVCQDGCIPAKAQSEIRLSVGSKRLPDVAWAPRIHAAELALPIPAAADAYSATLSGSQISLTFRQSASNGVTFYPADPVVEPSAPQTLRSEAGRSTLTLTLSQFAPSQVPRLRGLLVSQRGTTFKSESIDVPLQRKNL